MISESLSLERRGELTEVLKGMKEVARRQT